MTSPPENPAPVPPPDSWHFPPEPPPAQPPPWWAPQGGGAQGPYGQPYGFGYPPGGAGAPGADPGLAEWWRRLLARVIDLLAVAVLIMPVAITLLYRWAVRLEQITSEYRDLNSAAARAALNRADGRLLGSWLLLAGASALIWFGYDWLQHGLWGQTLGKRALGTRVVSAGDRAKIAGGAAALRAAVYALPPLVPLLGAVFALLNQLWLLWDPRRQCLHDKAARTVVIRTGQQR